MASMHRFDTSRTVVALASALLAASWTPVAAQQRTVVSNSVVVSGEEASLHLEFAEGDPLALSFANGTVRLDDEILGRYEAAGQADQAWRELLAKALPLANGPLAQQLLEWRPSKSLSPPDRNLLVKVDRALEDALRVAEAPDAGNGASQLDATGDWSAEVIEGSQVEGFWEAASYIRDRSFKVVAKEDYVVPSGASIDGTLLISGGRLDVLGTVRGGVIVVDGAVALHEGARVLGDLHLLESRLERRGGIVRGEVVDIQQEMRRAEERERDRLRAEVRRELREASMDARHDRVRRRGPSFFDRIGQALGGVMGTAFLFVVLGLLAAGATKLAGVRGDVVAKAAAHNPAKNVAVGLAGAFLALPAYVLGIVALAITIIGIPGLLVWVPLFPVAAAAIAFFGFVAASRNVGRWILDRNMSFLERADRHNPVHVGLVGIGALLTPYAVADVLGALPLVDWTSDFVEVAACLMVFATAVTGLGAVITTRGGKSVHADWELEDDFEAAAWSPDEGFARAKASEDAPSAAAAEEPNAAVEDAVEAPADDPAPEEPGQSEEEDK